MKLGFIGSAFMFSVLERFGQFGGSRLLNLIEIFMINFLKLQL